MIADCSAGTDPVPPSAYMAGLQGSTAASLDRYPRRPRWTQRPRRLGKGLGKRLKSEERRRLRKRSIILLLLFLRPAHLNRSQRRACSLINSPPPNCGRAHYSDLSRVFFILDAGAAAYAVAGPTLALLEREHARLPATF